MNHQNFENIFSTKPKEGFWGSITSKVKEKSNFWLRNLKAWATISLETNVQLSISIRTEDVRLQKCE